MSHEGQFYDSPLTPIGSGENRGYETVGLHPLSGDHILIIPHSPPIYVMAEEIMSR
jgi:hypothetical protein